MIPVGSGTPDALELTRRAFESANGGDYDAMMAFYGPASVWDVSPWGLGIHTGEAAIRRFLEDWMGGFERYEVTVEELHDLGRGVVSAVAVQHAWAARGRGHLRLRYAPVFVWSDGLALRVTHYREIDEARAAAERLAGERG